MAGTEALERAIAFIEASLGGDIGARDIAEAACLSPFHFARVFSASFLIGPWEWLVRRRVCEAAKALASGATDVTTAAFSFGFSGSDVFSRAYQRVTGTAPVETKRTGRLPRRMLEAPPRPVIRIAADPARRPRIEIAFCAAEAFRGETLFAAPVEDASARERLRAGNFASLLALGPRLRIVAAPPRPGFDALFASTGGEDGHEVVVPEGRYARCFISDPADLAAGRGWFLGVALASAAFTADVSTEIISVDDGGVCLRVPLAAE